ncbi:MAG: preprotein translocase subunit SecE, partial [Actinomycetota bacterium]|nr:preprotein translocase subunit SecE [Actinomycetota bacterium]
AELRKVIWPTRRDLVTYTAVVLVFVLFMVAVVSLFDFGFSQAVLAVFG